MARGSEFLCFLGHSQAQVALLAGRHGEKSILGGRYERLQIRTEFLVLKKIFSIWFFSLVTPRSPTLTCPAGAPPLSPETGRWPKVLRSGSGDLEVFRSGFSAVRTILGTRNIICCIYCNISTGTDRNFLAGKKSESVTHFMVERWQFFLMFFMFLLTPLSLNMFFNTFSNQLFL